MADVVRRSLVLALISAGGALAACSSPASSLATVSTTSAQTSTPASTTSTAAQTSTPSPSAALPTVDQGTQTTFSVPTGLDSGTTSMLAGYLRWETAYRRSMAAAALDPDVKSLGSGQALGVAQTTVDYLHSHTSTLVGPWQLVLSDVKSYGRTGVLQICIKGGSQVTGGVASALSGPTAETVTMNVVGPAWTVTGYDEKKAGCA